MEHRQQHSDCFLKTKDFSVSGETFSLVPQLGGTLLKTEPAPPTKELSRYYDHADYLSHTDGNRSLFERIYRMVKTFAATQKLKQIERFCPDKGRLLDIGAGTGDFIIAAQKRNWQAQGSEPNEKALAKARQKGLILERDTTEFEDHFFQVVTLWHVLEHLPDYQKQIEELLRLIAPGGLAVVAVPNFTCHSAGYYKEHWAAFDVPRHLWHFSKASLIPLFEKQGFKLIKIKPLWQDAYYINLLSEKYQTGKMRVMPAFFRATLCNLKGISDNNQSALTYFFQKNE